MSEPAELARDRVAGRPFDFEAIVSDPAPRADARTLPPLQAELIAATGAALLLASLLFLKWFGVGGVVGRFAPRVAATGSEGAWHTLTVLRWLVLLTVVVALMPLGVRMAQRWLGLPQRIHGAVAALGWVTALLLIYRVLIDLPEPSRVVDQKVGAILGVVGALVVAVGGVESLRGHGAPSEPDPAPQRPARDRGVAREIARINA